MNQTEREKDLRRLNLYDISISHDSYLVYKYYHADLFDCLKRFSKGKLLDIGCGNKPYASIVENLVTNYIGCDIIQSSDNTVDILCPATEIPVDSDTFDTVISTQTIEHVEDHQKLVNEAFRVLKKGGSFIVSGPMYWPLHEEPYDFFRFTKYGFRYVIEKAGFTIVEERANGGKWALCGQAFIQAYYSKNNGMMKSLKFRIIRKIINRLGGIAGINRFFEKLDDKYRDETNTMNYVFVAKK